MRICIAQINTTPGDFTGNIGRMTTGIERASAEACDIIVFPELTAPGYLSQDLLYNPAFIRRNLAVIDELKRLSEDVHEGLHIVFGYIGVNESIGKPFTNMAGVIHRGEMIRTYQKQLLPFYDVFDELRYFEAGMDIATFEVKGRKIGLAICEDLWNDKNADDYNYENNPLEQYRRSGTDIILSLNSSPFVQGKCLQRLAHIAPATKEGMAVVYVNQCGGQDELVFDGQSFVVQGNKLLYLNEVLFEDSFDIVALEDMNRGEAIPQALRGRTHALADLLVLGLKDYARKSGFDQLVLASSGGVDSAVVCRLACDAVGAGNVHAIRMPSVFSSEHSRDDARQLHANLGCRDYEVPIEHESLVAELKQRFAAGGQGSYNRVADENIQARLRDVYLMHFSNAYGAMPLSTGNKTEAGCGYYTHFDMNFSYAPIKDLYKFQVVDIARSDPAIPENIWRKPPSAELAANQTDEESLLPYPILDPVVMAYVEDYVTSFEGFERWVAEAREKKKISGDLPILDGWLGGGRAVDDYHRIVSLIGKMEYKRRQSCPGTKVSKVAFGTGRRIPIVEKWS